MIWVILGFVFWIALLFRQIMVFTVLSVVYALTGRSNSRLTTLLDSAIGFWLRGFVVIIENCFGSSSATTPPDTIGFGRVISESLYVVVFWTLVVPVLWFLVFQRNSSLNHLLNFPSTYGQILKDFWVWAGGLFGLKF
jgi:hypothetical protein